MKTDRTLLNVSSPAAELPLLLIQLAPIFRREYMTIIFMFEKYVG